MFWEVSRHPVTKRSLAKYNWIEKTITAINTKPIHNRNMKG